MDKPKKLKDWFGSELAELLADKISEVYQDFDSKAFIKDVKKEYQPLELRDRERLISSKLKIHLPADYPIALEILLNILGPENPKETGMFKNYWWVGPIAHFVQVNGLDHYDLSMKAIYEITKRNTGEFAIRPYIVAKPKASLKYMKRWAKDKSFHPRRLASEGLRPKLPWAQKLSVFLEQPEPVIEILSLLKEDDSKFVQKSVANHMNDLLKERPEYAMQVLTSWAETDNANTKWIIKHALRNLIKINDPKALALIN